MYDTGGDGWNGNILGVKQNNSIVGTFGASFTSGGTADQTIITVKGNIEVIIVVVQYGYFTN